MTLSEFEIKSLTKLKGRCEGGQVVELETEFQKEFWGNLEVRGYVEIAPFARCGFERIPGHFLSISEAGLLALENSSTKPAPSQGE
ncbi:MAG: hypothetical protein AAF468_20610 [Pseudomonadota bacterium]